ncbi:hypothetical protein ABZ815_20390 [Nonomuraea sp. NPDC047529]|uniref:hypothetical protein n=1 Tax=Nonomuraea sp. NPDC047529 TaxID=3155623 RepID=UPI00340C6FD8
MAADPDIEATWKTMHAALRAILQPHIQAALLEDDVTAIADWLNANGWKPPLRKLDPIIAAGRAARDHAARKEQQ